jgi:hypothetical protein
MEEVIAMNAVDSKTRFFGLPLAVVFVIVLASSCTHVYRVPEEPVMGYPSSEQIDLSVELRVTEDLEAAKWERKSMGDTWRMPIGVALVQNSKALATTIFTQAVCSDSASGSPPVDAVLTPRAVSIERSLGATAFGQSILTVVLEWKFEDPAGNLVWVDTVKGTAKTKQGNVFTDKKKAQEQIQLMLQDLFAKSFQAISTSTEIRKYAYLRKG